MRLFFKCETIESESADTLKSIDSVAELTFEVLLGQNRSPNSQWDALTIPLGFFPW